MSYLKYIELKILDDGSLQPMHDFKTFSTDFKNYDSAGVLLNNKVVVVDFDDYTDVGELIYNSFPTFRVNTRRGFHLYYKRPKTEQMKTPIRNYTDKLTVAGIKVDYKTTNRSFAVIKKNGKVREQENSHLFGKWDDLPELPLYLYPSKLKHDIYGLEDGHGRNSAMYTHLLSTLEQYSLNDDELNNLADFINNNVFAEPLPETELKNTIESVKNKKPNPNQQKYLDPKDIIMTSEVLVEKLDIHYYRGKLFFKDDDHYVTDDNLLLRAIDKLIQLKPNQHDQLIKLFKIKSHLQDDDDFPIQFRNGYVLYDDEMIQVDPGFTPYYLDVDYVPDAYDEDVDNFLDWFTCNRKDLRMFIEDVFGHVLMTRSFPHRAFFFWGESGDNGKSTIIKMLQSFVGDLYTNVPLDKFDDDTTVYSLLGKILNIADDIDASYLEKSSNFKTIASGDPVRIRPIYSPSVTLTSKATLIFTCNEIPIFKDKSGGIRKRMRVIPCDAKVVKRDRDIDKKLSTDNAKSYILNLALAGVERILKNGDLTKCEAVDEITRKYFLQTDSVEAFAYEYDIIGKTTQESYRMYVAYCEENGKNAVSSDAFGKRLSGIGYKSKPKWINGKNRRVYVKET